MGIESINREFVLNAEIGIGLPEGSLVVIETFHKEGTELSVLQVKGGTLHAPITAMFRLNNKPTTSPTLVTLVNSVTQEAVKVTLPENRGVVTVKLNPLITESTEDVSLKPLSQSDLKTMVQTQLTNRANSVS